MNNEEPKIISHCGDLVQDLVYVEPDIVEDQNNVDLPKNDLNQSFASIWPLEPCLDMAFNNSKDASSCMLQCICKAKGFQHSNKIINGYPKKINHWLELNMFVGGKGFIIKVVKIKKEKVHGLQKLEWDSK